MYKGFRGRDKRKPLLYLKTLIGMKIYINSITDVITNSSSECFIATKKVNDKLFKDLKNVLPYSKSTRITEKMVLGKWGRDNWMTILDALDLPYTVASTSGEWPSMERWNELMTKEVDIKLFNHLLDMYYMEIDDIEYDHVEELIEKFIEDGAIKTKVERDG